jgi:hypothetical protein
MGVVGVYHPAMETAGYKMIDVPPLLALGYIGIKLRKITKQL